MKTTILYLHESEACWMQWRGRRLLDVFCEPITRELAERAMESPKRDGVQSQCPWLSVYAPRIRLVIDPVVDHTHIIPSFDRGYRSPKGSIERMRRLAEQWVLACRSLTSDVLADDLTRYRRDQLKRFPKALLQWHPPNIRNRKSDAMLSSAAWRLTESGVPDFVFDWLRAMVDHGFDFVDVRPVSMLFAVEDSESERPVITVWEEAHRWRTIVTLKGVMQQVEQHPSQTEARIAVDERLSEYRERDLEQRSQRQTVCYGKMRFNRPRVKAISSAASSL